MTAKDVVEEEPVPVRFTPRFETRWSYEEFNRLPPFGPDSQGQAFGFTKAKSCRTEGERLSGSYRVAQLPRCARMGCTCRMPTVSSRPRRVSK
jgi:hypothetical protein